MRITSQQARSAAIAYVASERSGCHVEGLLEDDNDYLAVLALDDPDSAWPLGPGPVFINKASGEIWSDAYGNVIEKIDAMHSCTD